jgi:hypothetical protein
MYTMLARTCKSVVTRWSMNGCLRSVSVCGFLVFVMLAAGGVGSAQKTAADPLQPLAFLIGQWEGASDGQPASHEFGASTLAF